MAKRLIDFDAARAERVQEPLYLRAFGQEFELPAEMPAALALDIIRLQTERGDESEISLAETLNLLRRVLPKAVLDDLTAQDDFSAEDFGELTHMVLSAYSSGDGKARGKASPKAPRRASSPEPSSANQSETTASLSSGA
jgi:hypothetical protein